MKLRTDFLIVRKMKLYRFKTFTTSYYFPDVPKGKKWLYGLYSAYGGKISRLYWLLFRKISFVRWLNAVDTQKVSFPYSEICKMVGGNALMSFNMGSPGPLQKISIIGYDKTTKKKFFAKYSQKPKAIELTRNEIQIYKLLAGSSLVPLLYDSEVTNQYAFLKAEYVDGKRPRQFFFYEETFKLCMKLKEFRLSDAVLSKDNLILSLSHGDFCPWNMLEEGNNIRLIDWEQAKDRPLGFDLFTYIAQVTNLLTPEITLVQAIENHKNYIERFFNSCGVSNWMPYLKAFAVETKAFKLMKGNPEIAARYDCLLNL